VPKVFNPLPTSKVATMNSDEWSENKMSNLRAVLLYGISCTKEMINFDDKETVDAACSDTGNLVVYINDSPKYLAIEESINEILNYGNADSFTLYDDEKDAEWHERLTQGLIGR